MYPYFTNDNRFNVDDDSWKSFPKKNVKLSELELFKTTGHVAWHSANFRSRFCIICFSAPNIVAHLTNPLSRARKTGGQPGYRSWSTTR